MDELRASFKEAMDNDLNTSLGVTAVYNVLKADLSDAAKRALIAEFDSVLSLNLLEPVETAAAPQDDELTAWVEERIARQSRLAGRNEKCRGWLP